MFSRLFYNEYGFKILVYGAIFIIAIIFVYNRLYSQRGSFVDYSNYMLDLFNKPVGLPTYTDDDDDDANRGATRRTTSRGEIECKRSIENITGKPFEKRRPSFLRNHITDANLELDCYNEELKLAVEYNGEQHYKFVPYFHRTRDAFYNTKYRDDIKRQLCAKNGIRLIVVPYTVDIDDITNFLSQQLT